MTLRPRLRTVALLARSAGVRVLRDSLLRNPVVELVAVATHRLLPRAEDPARGERSEYAELARLCADAGIPLVDADTRDLAAELSFASAAEPIDLIASVSWRYVLTRAALARSRLGVINLHRGLLPDFAGAEPVRRAIEAARPTVTITAHLMVEEVDAGPVLAEVHAPTLWDGQAAAVVHAERVKARLLPLYAPLLDVAIAARLAAEDA